MDDADADRGKRVMRREDLIYPELSYKIVGALFDVYNHLGPGHLEKIYQRAVAVAFRDKKLAFQQQIGYDIVYHGNKIGRGRLDFLVENKVVVELKQGDRYRKQNLDQIINYLKTTDKQLAILANFTREGVQFRRLLNSSLSNS